MSKADVIAPWLKAFETDDPATGGCASVPGPVGLLGVARSDGTNYRG